MFVYSVLSVKCCRPTSGLVSLVIMSGAVGVRVGVRVGGRVGSGAMGGAVGGVGWGGGGGNYPVVGRKDPRENNVVGLTQDSGNSSALAVGYQSNAPSHQCDHNIDFLFAKDEELHCFFTVVNLFCFDTLISNYCDLTSLISYLKKVSFVRISPGLILIKMCS